MSTYRSRAGEGRRDERKTASQQLVVRTHGDDENDGEEDDEKDDPKVEEAQFFPLRPLHQDMLGVWHTSLVCRIERPEDVVLDRHMKVWEWSISREHLNRRSVKGRPFRIIDKTDQDVCNRGREATRKEKNL